MRSRRPAAGLAVARVRRRLEHPRWLYVLPNGDVLVAETNAPPKPEDGKGIKGWVMKQADEARPAPACRAPTASRCCATPTATASPRRARVFLEGLQLAVRHGAGRRRPLRRQHRRAACASRTTTGETRDHGAGDEGRSTCPAGRINHHWTKNVIASPDGTQALRRPSARTATSARTASTTEEGRAAIWEVDRDDRRSTRVFATGPAQSRTAWPGSRRPARCGRRSTSATSSAATSCPTT